MNESRDPRLTLNDWGVYPAVSYYPQMTQRLGMIYAGYRIILPVLLFILFFVTRSNPIIGGNSPFIYLGTLIIHELLALICFYIFKKWPVYLNLQLIFMLCIDIGSLSILLYTNDGPSLQISMLYLVVVAAANIVLPPTLGLSVALFAVITVIWQQFYTSLLHSADTRSISSALLLSLSFLGVSLLTRQTARRLHDVEKVAAEQAQQMRQLQMINEQIIERMQAGALVVNAQGTLLLSNLAAQQMLGRVIHTGESLAQHFTALQQILDDYWSQKTPVANEIAADPQYLRPTLGVQLTTLNQPNLPPLTLILLENLDRVHQQAQHMKLASLGRLTASIAHEIRNPLAAISQATELLYDCPDEATHHMLLDMLDKQTKRVNRIIEDVLQLSRRDRTVPERLNLNEWLPDVLAEHFDDTTPFNIQLDSDLWLRFDPDQLRQVLVNLIQNALHHSRKRYPLPVITILGKQEQNRVWLDVIDQGPGITEQVRATLFEPFFTTEQQGTGLGLYLARAYCEANGAKLYEIPQIEGACFRIESTGSE